MQQINAALRPRAIDRAKLEELHRLMDQVGGALGTIEMERFPSRREFEGGNRHERRRARKLAKVR